MSDGLILYQEPSDCGIVEKISLETPSSSSFSVSDTNNIGLPYQSEPVNGGSIIQSSPPHYRHSRAYRHFKNPPQPHMCIRTTTEHGEELFINVLSWTRIVIPQEPSDPIPLYGGMRVPPGSPRSPPIVFAVMANPEVLKDSGRHSKDPEERRAMIELMCDFVEAMNPGVKLIRNAVILKDRDISGELKDVWNAVQAQRDREREEQLVQQRQQQHYHNTTTQQLFPKLQNPSLENSQSEQQGGFSNSNSTPENKIIYMEFGPDSSRVFKNEETNDLPIKVITSEANVIAEPVESAIIQDEEEDNLNNRTQDSETKKEQTSSVPPDPSEQAKLEPALIQVNNIHNSKLCSIAHIDNITKPKNVSNAGKKVSQANIDVNPSSTTTNKTPSPAPTKKEKLGGFLPNGCIFPRFKNNKHKDKDKDSSKSASKDREKNLLHALKKSKDKPDDTTRTAYEKNCINLESDVEKLDLNKIETSTSNDNMFMKLKVATSAAK